MQDKTNLPSQQGTQTTAVTQSVNFFDPQQFETAQRMSKLFAASMLAPDTYQADKIATELMQKKHLDAAKAQQQGAMTAVANCMIALDIATRIGASPLMVMQNLVIIYGRPSWSSKFLIATVNTCGRFEPLKFKFSEKGRLGKVSYTEYVYDPASRMKRPVTKEFDGTKIQDIECIAYTTAKGSKEVLESSPVSLRMAIDEGWYTKNGSKWRTMPKQMLMYRAASFWTSAYAPELSMGMHTVEEVQDAGKVIDITDTAEEVEQEKEQNANAQTIHFGDEPHGAAPTPTANVGGVKVDTETGEIFDEGAMPGKPDDEGKNAPEAKAPASDGPGY